MNASPMIRELLELPVRVLAELPVPTTLVVAMPKTADMHFTSGRRRAQELRDAGAVVFTPLEYEALALGLQERRASPKDVLRWVREKRRAPQWRLSAEEAVADAIGLLVGDRRTDRAGREIANERRAAPASVLWTWGQLLEALGGELVDVQLEDGHRDVKPENVDDDVFGATEAA